MLEAITNINNAINNVVWTQVGLWLLIGVGIIMTCCTKVFQLSHLRHWWKNTIGSMFTKRSYGTHKGEGLYFSFSGTVHRFGGDYRHR